MYFPQLEVLFFGKFVLRLELLVSSQFLNSHLDMSIWRSKLPRQTMQNHRSWLYIERYINYELYKIGPFLILNLSKHEIIINISLIRRKLEFG
jgi:hypothetical protein